MPVTHFDIREGTQANYYVRSRNGLRPQVAELTRNAPTEGAPQEIWYAAAPLLLDRQTPETMRWLHSPAAGASTNGGTDDPEPTAWQSLVARVSQGIANPASLGRPPRDLVEVMAELAAGSPANATLRALSRITSTSTADSELKTEAMRAGWAFRSLFRAPTSEGLLRNAYQPGVPGGQGSTGGECWPTP